MFRPPHWLQIRHPPVHQGRFTIGRPVIRSVGQGDIGDGVVVEPLPVFVLIEIAFVENRFAADVDLPQPPSCDGNRRCYGGNLAAPPRRNDLDRALDTAGDQLINTPS